MNQDTDVYKRQAKGYAVDVIAQLLEKKCIGNFMVDIGGEVVVRCV